MLVLSGWDSPRSSNTFPSMGVICGFFLLYLRRIYTPQSTLFCIYNAKPLIVNSPSRCTLTFALTRSLRSVFCNSPRLLDRSPLLGITWRAEPLRLPPKTLPTRRNVHPRSPARQGFRVALARVAFPLLVHTPLLSCLSYLLNYPQSKRALHSRVTSTWKVLRPSTKTASYGMVHRTKKSPTMGVNYAP